MQRLKRAEKFIRWMRRVTLQDKKTSEDLRQRLGIVSECDGVCQGRLRWFRHVVQKNKGEWVSACRYISCRGKRQRKR